MGTSEHDNENRIDISSNTVERDAVYERIYQKYGSDLEGFFRDVYKEAVLRQRKLERRAADRSEAATAQ